MGKFPVEETEEIKKPPSSSDVWEAVSRGAFSLSNLDIRLSNKSVGGLNAAVPDIQELMVKWGRISESFLAEYKPVNTPRVLSIQAAQLCRLAESLKSRPLVIVPYLSENSLDFLEQERVSGLDLGGNALIMGEQFMFRRDGNLNCFKSSQPIKNVFRGTSSLFARCFLIRNRFSSLTELREFALSRIDSSEKELQILRKGTASKVVNSLVEELIVAREGDQLRLLDPAKLLSLLRQNYTWYGIREVEAKTDLSLDECWRRLRGSSVRRAMTGLGSAGYYGLLSGTARQTICVDDIDRTLESLDARPTKVFPNLRLIETKGDVPFFDLRNEGDVLWASPIQTWLELSNGGPREREVATNLERELLSVGGLP